MAYSIDRADLVAALLERFTSGYSHYVAGHWSNVDYWMGEVIAACDGLDGYLDRLESMAAAQHAWVELHDTKVGDYCPTCRGRCEFSEGLRTPGPPRRVPARAMSEARRRVVDAGYHFLMRCYRLRLLDLEELRSRCQALGSWLSWGEPLQRRRVRRGW